MLVRYGRDQDGKPVKKALVYTASEHAIPRDGIDPDAERIVERLRHAGHEAYIVGGAVRDLLVGKRPKDFDIVTDAQPGRIKRIFPSARVIGRRFRLVHVYAGQKIFEVCTFRSIKDGTVGNTYGSIDEDALRRDFTINALYYDPIDRLLVDYVGGFKDCRAMRLKPIIPLSTIFVEDPVRMLRAVKYASISGFKIGLATRWTIWRQGPSLATASTSRLSEEFIKILGSGHALAIVESLERYGLLAGMLPKASARLGSNQAYAASLRASLAELDAYAAKNRQKRLGRMLEFWVRPLLESMALLGNDGTEAYRTCLQASRDFLEPLTMPRVELEHAVLFLFKARGLDPYKPSPGDTEEGEEERPRKRRRRGGAKRRGGASTGGDREGGEPLAGAGNATS